MGCCRNYHVFYYLLAGASTEDKEVLHLTNPEEYFYLNQVRFVCWKPFKVFLEIRAVFKIIIHNNYYKFAMHSGWLKNFATVSQHIRSKTN